MKKNVVEKYENHAVLKCVGNYPVEFIIDLDRADEIAKHNWNVNKAYMLKTQINKETVTMQRFLTGGKKGDFVKRLKGEKNDMRRECFLLIKVGE